MTNAQFYMAKGWVEEPYGSLMFRSFLFCKYRNIEERARTNSRNWGTVDALRELSFEVTYDFY